eukprot:238047-Pleurochrysis_carterae.AAC.5
MEGSQQRGGGIRARARVARKCRSAAQTSSASQSRARRETKRCTGLPARRACAPSSYRTHCTCRACRGRKATLADSS